MARSKTILLVNPWIHDFSAYDLWMKPLGLLYIAAFLRHYGYRIKLVDCLNRFHGSVKNLPHSEQPKDKEFGCGELPRQSISKPDIFKNIPRKYKRYGITPEAFKQELIDIASPESITFTVVTSMMTYWYPGVFETIHCLKETFPETPIALGGIYVTLCYEHAQKYARADYLIKGPGELEVLKLADQITGINRDYTKINTDLDSLSCPAYDIYFESGGKRLDYVSMMTSKGCPFCCTYCASSLLAPSFYQRQPEKVVAEIGYYAEQLGVQDIAFYDDALLVNAEKHLLRILELVQRRKLSQKLRFHTPNGLHIKYITQPVAEQLYQASFKTIRLGFVPSHYQQVDSSYKTTQQELKKSITYLTQAGYNNSDIGVYIMIGLPGESLTELNQTIDFVHDCGVKIKIAQYSPVPGTRDFKRAVEEFNLVPDEPLWHNKSVYPLRGKIPFDEMEAIKDRVKRLNRLI